MIEQQERSRLSDDPSRHSRDDDRDEHNHSKDNQRLGGHERLDAPASVTVRI
jgi:hypothetical protein